MQFQSNISANYFQFTHLSTLFSLLQPYSHKQVSFIYSKGQGHCLKRLGPQPSYSGLSWTDPNVCTRTSRWVRHDSRSRVHEDTRSRWHLGCCKMFSQELIFWETVAIAENGTMEIKTVFSERGWFWGKSDCGSEPHADPKGWMVNK